MILTTPQSGTGLVNLGDGIMDYLQKDRGPIVPVCRLHPEGYDVNCKECDKVKEEFKRIAKMLKDKFTRE